MGNKTVDCVSKCIGYAAVREWTPSPRSGERILDLKPYTQINSFSCGVAAGFSVVKSFYPTARFEDFYDRVDPDEEMGTPTVVLRKALRKSRISIKSPRLSYQALLGHIREGHPVIVVIRNPGADYLHWVVAYGFGRNHIILASKGVPWLHQKRVPRKDFMTMWEPRGNGIVCGGESRRRRLPFRC